MAQTPQALIINVDNPNRCGLVHARLPTLKLVKYGMASGLHHQRIPQIGEGDQGHREHRNEKSRSPPKPLGPHENQAATGPK